MALGKPIRSVGSAVSPWPSFAIKSNTYQSKVLTAKVSALLLTSAQVGQKLDFELPTKLVGSHFLCPTSCREVDFRNSVQLGQNYFFAIFSWNASKNTFLVGYHWERFFLKSLTKMPLPLATTWRSILKITTEARIKSLFSAATIWERLWTKCRSHRLPLERKFPAPGTNLNVFSGGIWRNFSKTRW